MLVVMNSNSPEEYLKAVEDRIAELGLESLRVPGANRVSICVLGNQGEVNPGSMGGLKNVKELIRVTKPYKLVSREVKQEDTIIQVGDVPIGGPHCFAVAGPCSVEDRETTVRIAKQVKAAGATLFRGMIYKPRTSPYSFQGQGSEAFPILKEIREEVGLPVVTEVMSETQIDELQDQVDVLQIGTRNMQNFNLLKALGAQPLPLILKRGMSASLEDFLMAAEYLLSFGNHNVILCERGIRTFSQHSRNTFDLNIVPRLKELTHLPVVVDPSHATGIRSSVPSMSLAGIAAGADGLLIEVHENPDQALSDSQQTVDVNTFKTVLDKSRKLQELMKS